MGKKKKRKMTSDEILDEFEKAPEIRTPHEMKSFLHCGDREVREIAKLIAALCQNEDEWQEVFVADWTLYPKDECYQVKHCKEAEALEFALKEYDATVSFDAPGPRWLFLQRYSRSPVGDETIIGTRKFNEYLLNVPYETSKINLGQDSATTARFAQFATEGRYSAIEEENDVRDFSEKERQTTGEDFPEDYVPREERPSIVVFNSKFRVRRNAFASAFMRVAKCALKESKNPNERNVNVVANHNGIFLSATDGEFTALEKIVDRGDFRVLISGAFLVDPNDLAKLFSESEGSRDETLGFSTHFSFLTIKGARFRYRFFVEDAFIPHIQKDPSVGFERQEDVQMDVEQEIPEFCEEQGYFEMESESLRQMIRRTLRAVDSTPKKRGVRKFTFIFDENETVAYGTDGRVFACQRSQSRYITTRKSIVPFGQRRTKVSTKTLRRLEGFLSGSEKVQIALSEGRAQIRTENALLTFPTEFGSVLPVDQILDAPKTLAPEGSFFAGDLATALRCVLGNEEWSDENDERPVTLEVRNKRLVLTRNRRLMSPPIVEVPLKYVGNRASVVLDARRLYDFVDSFPPEEQIDVRLDVQAAALFKTSDGFRYLAREI